MLHIISARDLKNICDEECVFAKLSEHFSRKFYFLINFLVNIHVSPVGHQRLIFFAFFFFFFYHTGTSNTWICYSDLWFCVGVSSRRTFIVYLILYNICALQIALIYAGVQFVLANGISKKKSYYNIYVLHRSSTAAGDQCGPVKNMIYSIEFSLRACLIIIIIYYFFFSTAY